MNVQEKNRQTLVRKYNVPGPRYTSYPTVPFWDTPPDEKQWSERVYAAARKHATTDGLSIYVHLPYCESLCTYCGCNTRITVNHAVEQPYIKALCREWDMYLKAMDCKPLLREMHFGGGTPTFFSPDHLVQLINHIRKTSDTEEDTEFGFEAHPNNTTSAHLKQLYSVGFRRLSLGVQDFDPVVQKRINRRQTYADVEQVVNEARSIGYRSINFDLIYGLPLQQLSSVENTIRQVGDIMPDRIALYSYAHVPWQRPAQKQFTEEELPTDEAKRALYEKAKEMLSALGYAELGMDHFALKTDDLFVASGNGKLHRNFMGYSPRHSAMMIGLGVSAIGDTWDAFAQNIKTVEPYLQTIDEGRLPIFRGHLLNDEDKAIRKHILNLMCRFHTDWNNDDAAVRRFMQASRPEWSEMESDGLVSLGDHEITVNDRGRAFVRNVCMVIDARLKRKQPDQQIFSRTV